MIATIIDKLLGIFGFTSVMSLMLIVIYMKVTNQYSFTQMRYNPLWPKLIIEYRDFTKKKTGRVGALYYLFIVSVSFVVVCLIIKLVLWLFGQ